MKVFIHFILILLSFGVSFIIIQTSLENYTVQILALSILIYFFTSFILKKKNPNAPLFGKASDIIILIISILLLISISGNIYSPLFFLIYFLGFGITFIFEPFSVIFFAIGALLYFLPEAVKNGSVESFLRIGSILLIAPLAFFFGEDLKEKENTQEKLEELKERDLDSAEIISKDIENIIESDKKKLNPEEIERLNEVLEETENLRSENEN